jgi:hypothetical protein
MRYSYSAGLLATAAYWNRFRARAEGIKRKTWWRPYAKGGRDEQRGVKGMAAAMASLTAKLGRGLSP